MLFGCASCVMPPRWARSPGFSRSPLVDQGFVVSARGFHKAGAFFNGVAPPGNFANTFLCVLRFLLLQPFSGQGLENDRPEPRFGIGFGLLLSYAYASRSRVVDGFDVPGHGFFHQPLHATLSEIRVERSSRVARMYSVVRQVDYVTPERFSEVSAFSPGMSGGVAPYAL